MLDLAIIGGGPAGLTAALYASRGGLSKVTVFEGDSLGGQIIKSSEIENYPGFNEVVDGFTLMQNWPEQAQKFGTVIESMGVSNVCKDGEIFKITLSDGKKVEAKTVIVATGSSPKKGGYKGEDEFFGKGVSTCATCDGFFYKGKDVAVIGGGETALEETIFLSNIVNKVHLIHRGSTFKASKAVIDRAMRLKNVEFLYNSNVVEIRGNNSGVTNVEISSGDKNTVLDVSGAFIFVGRHINNSVLKGKSGFLCDTNEYGEVITDLNMNTSVSGLFVAGDIRLSAPKQVVCAASDGAIAGMQALNYILLHS